MNYLNGGVLSVPASSIIVSEHLLGKHHNQVCFKPNTGEKMEFLGRTEVLHAYFND
jgi:hypothetical protein